LHQQAGKPAGNRPDHDSNDECRQHCFPPLLNLEPSI
jgi:hypothetical protein